MRQKLRNLVVQAAARLGFVPTSLLALAEDRITYLQRDLQQARRDEREAARAALQARETQRVYGRKCQNLQRELTSANRRLRAAGQAVVETGYHPQENARGGWRSK